MEVNVKQNQQKKFVFLPAISKNIYDTSWKGFLASFRRKAEFERSNVDIAEFVTKLVDDKIIKHEKLNEFLFSELSYGMHKDVMIFRFLEIKILEDKLLEILNSRFKITDLNYNQLDRINFINTSLKEDIGAVKVDVDSKNNIVNKLEIIFVKKVKYKTKEESINFGRKEIVEVEHYENSYIPIEIDFNQMTMIVKSAPKSRINIPEFKGLNLSKYYADMIIDIFDMKVITKQLDYQKTLYNMCDILLNGVIKEQCKTEIKLFNESINLAEQEFQTKFKELHIDINELSNTVTNKNVFDLKNHLLNMIENVVITKRLNEVMKNKDGIDGIISYIKFKDKSAVNTVLKTDSRQQTLLDSQAFLDLRKTIRECKLAERIRVSWYNNKEEIQLSYDARKLNYLHIHFYEMLFEGELRYAIRKLEEFE